MNLSDCSIYCFVCSFLQEELFHVIPRIVEVLKTHAISYQETAALFLWCALFIGRICESNVNAFEKATLANAPEILQTLLIHHDSPEVRAACAYAIGNYLSSSHVGNETGERRNEQCEECANNLILSLHDGSPMVRQEVLVALHHFLNNFSRPGTSGSSINTNFHRGSNLVYKTIFDKVTEAIQNVIACDPSREMIELAETIIKDIQQPVTTNFFSWCCGRFRVSNTISRDLGTGIQPARGALQLEDESCFSRGARYWRNHCTRSQPIKLADFQYMRETPFTSRISHSTPLVIRLHPYDDYLTVANSHGNLNFYDLNGNPRPKSILKVTNE